MNTKKCQVICPITNQAECVYVYCLGNTKVFNGCDNNFSARKECTEMCRAMAFQLCDQEAHEGPLPHGRSLK